MEENQEKKTKKNRVQLFADPAAKTNHGGESFVQKIEGSSDPKLQILAERFSSVPQTKEGGKNLKLNSSNKGARRSLDSCMNRPHNSPKTPVGFSLADFEVKSSKQSKKKKNRKSDPILMQSLDDSKRSEAKPIEIRRSPEKSVKEAPIAPLAKMTPEKKSQFDKSELWDKITSSIDKTPKSSVRSRPVPKLVSPLKSTVPEDTVEFVEPAIEEVTHGERLEKLAVIYSLCIRLHKAPNILVELYSIFQVLTVKDSQHLYAGRKSSLLSSVHNCVFFAAKVLEDQLDLLEHLDRATLVFLVENPRLDQFCPDVKTRLMCILSSKKTRHGSNGQVTEMISSVRFQTETDSRDTFPDAQTFQDFKKQRDMFYEMLRNWRSSVKDTLNFSSLVTKLLSTQEHPINLQHFSKLFHDQLVSMCLSEAYNNGQQEIDEANLEADLKLLSELKQKMPPAKWSSLQSRFLMRSQFGGPNPDPGFYGCQEFFRDFLSSSTFAFVSHFKNLLVQSISSLNKTQFDLEDVPRNEICRVILSLRILAKFLAFIETLPYVKCSNNLTPEMVKSLHEAQINTKPCLDLHQILHQACRDHRLIITLPWIVEFCSILDPVSIQLPYYNDLFKGLISIYQCYLMTSTPNESKFPHDTEISETEELLSPVKQVGIINSDPSKRPHIGSFNAFFLCIHLGWLFEHQSFPRELFIDEPDPSQFVVSFKEASLDGNDKALKLSLLYNCCPYVSELKVILCQFHTGFKASKVMPTKTTSKDIKLNVFQSKEHTDPQQSIQPENMQTALEANFFHNQPASVKHTVDIITERITSNFVRILSNELIPSESKSILQELTENLKLLCTSQDDLESIKEELLSQVSVMANQSQAKIRDSANQIINDQLKVKVEPALICLLPDDTKSPVANFCSQIIERRIRVHASQWMRVNMSQTYFHQVYQKEFEKLWSDHVKSLQGPLAPVKQTAVIFGDEAKIRREIAIPISEVLIKLKARILFSLSSNYCSHYKPSFQTEMSNMTERKKIDLTSSSLMQSLDQVEVSYALTFIEASKDDRSLLDVSVKGFENLSFDWALSIIVYYPAAMTAAVQERLMSLWGAEFTNLKRPMFSLSQPPAPVATLLSSRNFSILSNSPNPNATWDKLESFMGRLLASGLMLPICLEEQCLVILKKEWPNDLLRRLGSCLNGVIDSWQKKGMQRSREDLLNFTEEFLSWFAWLMSEIGGGDDGLDDSLENFPELGF